MSKRMMFSSPKRRAPRLSTLILGAALMCTTGAAFAAGLHVGVTYGGSYDTPRVIVSAASLAGE
ncbi:hypothetical protein [Pyruvatibacter mobilis]|uniref:hypothetical protein n=1 Tax=Pyruvatibacter mobilis TaxID=1712261 RepID=UPI003BACE907